VPWGFISDDGNPVHIGDHIQTVRLSRGHVADLVIPDEAHEYVPQRHVLGVDEARRGTITVDKARQLIPGFRDDYPQRYVTRIDQDETWIVHGTSYTLADDYPPRVRFWQDHNGHRWLLEGTSEVQRYEVGLHPMVRLHARLHDVMQAFQALGVAFEQATAPLTEMIEDLITMEVETPGGFEPLGYIHPENFEFVEDRECVREWVPTEMVDATRSQMSLTGRFVQTFAVRHEVTVEFDPATVGPGMERLIR
jgi:hypothetical protein